MRFIPRQHIHTKVLILLTQARFFCCFYFFVSPLLLEEAPFYSDMEFHPCSGTLLLSHIHTDEIRIKPNTMLMQLSGTPLLATKSDGFFG